ncbi:hypothetical protein [Bosea sp. ANAM02]|uniref:hypothetical protein n=1 Tax=Bosea sp. ANAM02 TaxID=2020412 RepID=UPI0015665BC0|nr:hypothetical protein [Bosea sp. ANAM02]
MIATMIDGVVHFFDRSYARSVGRVENMIGKTINENIVELEGYGTLKLVVDVFSIGGNGAEIPMKACWLNPDQMMILLMLSRTPAGKAMRRKMVDLKNAIRDGRLVYADGGLVTSEPAKSAGTAVVPARFVPAQSRWSDEAEFDTIEAQDRRARGIHNPTPFLVDTRNALRIRYDHFARRVDIPMRSVWLSFRDARDALAKLAPILTRKEDGPLPYSQMDGGCHEAIYLTLGQAHHLCLDLDVEHHWQSVIAAFEAYNAFLTGETEQEIAWRKSREADAARLAATPTTFGLIESMTTRTESASAQVSGSVDALAEAVAKMSGLLTASLEQQAKRKWPVA